MPRGCEQMVISEWSNHTKLHLEGDFTRLRWDDCHQTVAAIALKLYVCRLRTCAVTQVQISLGRSWKREKYGHYVCPVEWMSYDFVFVITASFPSSFCLCSLIHWSVWVQMHNEFIRGDWRNQERYCLNYWLRARSICSLCDRRAALSTELTNLIKCTKCHTLTSPPGAIMAVGIERSPPGVFYLLLGDCLCQLADCIDYIDL